MIVNGGCPECGNYHRLDFLVCPNVGRPEPRAATPPPPVVTAEEQLHEREILARGERNRQAREHERSWAKTKTLVRAVVEEQRQVDALVLNQDRRAVHGLREEQEKVRRLRRNHALRDVDRPASPTRVKTGTSTAVAVNVVEQVKDDVPLVPDLYPKKMEVVWTRDRHE